MGLLNDFLSGVDNLKRKASRNIWDAVSNPGDFADMTAARMQEDRYGGPEEASAMKSYLSRQPYDQVALQRANDALVSNAVNAGFGSIVVPSLSKTGDPRDAAANLKQILEKSNGKMPFDDISKMTKEEFGQFYDYAAPHHQGKFDRLLRSYAPQYDDLPKTMQDYAQDFKYENPRLVSKLQGVKPDDKVDIYRSVTATDPDASILPGDWVALERNYAAQHGHLGNDKPRLMKMKVPAKDVRWAGTSADEYFYVPSEQVDQSVYSKYDALQKFVGGLLNR